MSRATQHAVMLSMLGLAHPARAGDPAGSALAATSATQPGSRGGWTPPPWLHGIVEFGTGYATVVHAADVIDPQKPLGGELFWGGGGEVDLPWAGFRLGATASLHAGGHEARWWEVGVRGTWVGPAGWRTHLDLGWFTCDDCRSSDRTLFVGLHGEYRTVSVFVETRIVAYDAFEAFRPLGTQVSQVVGLRATTWQACLVVLGIEAVVGMVAVARAFPGPDDY